MTWATVARDRKLAMRYLRAGRERVERTVDPLGLVAKGGVWYLVAHTPAGFRTYRVSRIEEATLLDQPCARPADFDLAAYWQSSTEELRQRRSRYEVTLRLESRAAASLASWRRTAPVEPADRGAPAGWVTVRTWFEDEEQARFIVLGCGPRAEVLAPAELRAAVAADLAAAVERLGAAGRRPLRPRPTGLAAASAPAPNGQIHPGSAAVQTDMLRSPSACGWLAALLLAAVASPGGRATASPEVETAVFAVG